MFSGFSPLTIFVAIVALILTLGGEIGSVLFLNWWLVAFPSGNAAPLTIQLSSSLLYLLVFIVVVLGYLIAVGPSTVFIIAKAKGRRGVIIAILMGLTDLGSNILAVYAANHVPEIVQAFMQSAIPPWALLLQYFMVKNQKSMNYKSLLLIGSIVFAVAGIVGSSIPPHPDIKSSYTDNVGSFIGWLIIYAVSTIIYAYWCILQRQYCDHVPVENLVDIIRGHHKKMSEESAGGASTWTPPMLSRILDRPDKPSATVHHSSSGSGSSLAIQEEPTTTGASAAMVDDEQAQVFVGSLEKTLMLLGDTFFQVLWTLIISPIDALPWYGTSPNIAATWSNLTAGFHCIFTCPSNFLWCFLYSFSYFVSYLGDAYLNRVSPTLCSIIIQISAPVTAILLIIFPAWNVAAGGSAQVLWWQQLLAAVAMTASAVLYYKWERKEEARQLAEEETRNLIQKEDDVNDVNSPTGNDEADERFA